MAPSKRTVQFEFQVEADDRQLGRFSAALQKINSATAVSESVLSGLRRELVELSKTTVQTENGLQAQIAALRDASRNADLTASEYEKLRREAHALQQEYKLLTTNIVGLDKTYKVATRSANEFSQAQKDAAAAAATAAQRSTNLYMNNAGQRSADSANRSQFLAGTSGADNLFPLDPRSEGGMQQRITQLRNQASAVAMTEDKYRELRLELIALEGQYKKLSLVETDAETAARRRAERSDKLKYVGRTVRNVAAAGFFGGPEGLAGAAIGGIIGGPAGAEIGAGVGLAAQQLRIQAAAVTDLVAKLNLAKTTLAQVSVNQADYSQKLQFARQVSTDYSVGLQATIEGYANVTAAAAANGLTLKQTETIYKGLLASGVAFGASQDDLKSIITATTQVLSKGKLSAEEVSGQLGERIPGAVAKLAQATGRSLKQLADDFQNGKVNIADFVKFADKQFTDYDGAAKLIGSSPEKAGERLNIALTRMAELYGGFFQTVGAGFQDLLTGIINWANDSAKALFRVIASIKLFVNDLKFEVAVASNFLGIDSRKPANDSSSLTPYGSFSAQKPTAISGSGMMPYGSFSGTVSSPVKTSQELAREKWLEEETARLLSGKMPTKFGGNKPAPILGDLTAPDDKAGRKASADADKAARKAQTDADNATRLQEKLESEQRRRDELLANNAIQLADRVFQHRMDLLRQEYDLNQQLIDATRAAQEAGMTGVARNMQGTINQILGIYDRLKQGRFNDALDLRLADQQITTERKSAENTARYQEVPQSAVGGGRSGFPEFVSANQMRAWLKSEGYERTEGDFTNKGHRTPNHMLNAIDTGELDGSYSNAVQRAKDLEARLRRTGAFGDQLFGPTRDPRGHKDHVHIPTPGGRIRVTPGLAEEMQLGTTQARTQPGVNQGINRNIVDTGNVDLATAGKVALTEKQKQESQLLFKIAETQAETLIQNTTTAYRDQTQALQDQLQEFRDRNRLQLEGVKPEIIEQQMQLNKITRDYTRESETLTSALSKVESNATRLQAQLGLLGQRTKNNAASYDALTASIKDNASLYNILTNGVKDLTVAYNDNRLAQEALNRAENDKRNIFKLDDSVKAGIDGYITSIGTLNQAVTGLTQKGFGGMSTALKELATTGTTDFRSFAVSMLTDMTEVIVQQLVVAQLADTIGRLMNRGTKKSSGGGILGFMMEAIVPSIFTGAGPIKFAKGGVMTDNGPLKLHTYARGGIANTPQFAMFGEGSMPEAYVPLPDGKRIPVAMQGSGGGGSNQITINVDASGTKAQGDSGASGALARDLARVVDDRLIHHRRPGGLLSA